MTDGAYCIADKTISTTSTRMILQDAIESIMLLCFGLAWPVANLRMLRTRCPEGKGLAFALIIMVGYLAGTSAK